MKMAVNPSATFAPISTFNVIRKTLCHNEPASGPTTFVNNSPRVKYERIETESKIRYKIFSIRNKWAKFVFLFKSM